MICVEEDRSVLHNARHIFARTFLEVSSGFSWWWGTAPESPGRRRSSAATARTTAVFSAGGILAGSRGKLRSRNKCCFWLGELMGETARDQNCANVCKQVNIFLPHLRFPSGPSLDDALKDVRQGKQEHCVHQSIYLSIYLSIYVLVYSVDL